MKIYRIAELVINFIRVFAWPMISLFLIFLCITAVFKLHKLAAKYGQQMSQYKYKLELNVGTSTESYYVNEYDMGSNKVVKFTDTNGRRHEVHYMTLDIIEPKR